jgi:(R)-2-hydroxyacyl-CoA dehydratese activating ATPase
MDSEQAGMAAREDVQRATQTLYAGVDIGSLGTKAVVLSSAAVVGTANIPTGVFPEQSGREALRQALAAAGGVSEQLGYVVATGYGRISAQYANKTITEITCHAQGASFLHPATRTIIDIGGQDCKTIRLDEDGHVADFAMNDKCAAGTGRFLEVMSTVFNLPLEKLGELAHGDAPLVPINNTCTVFAETEIISLIARGERAESILKGVFTAIASRVNGLIARIGVEDDVFFSGGVAKNYGVVSALERVLGRRVFVPDIDPQLVGALGAAVLARQSAVRSQA